MARRMEAHAHGRPGESQDPGTRPRAGESTLTRRTSILTGFIGVWVLFGAMAVEASPAGRAADVLAAVLLCIVSYRDLTHPTEGTRWTLVGIGVWFLFCPLLFWAPAAACAVDQLAGTLVIVLAAVQPEYLTTPSERPPGWSYNPSTWSNRVPIAALALSGFFAARAMSAFQLGHVGAVWEPFFGDGTRRVLTSDVARAFPISDAGLGAVAYLLEGISGVVGDQRRWKTMPWMVLLFFVLVVPAGVVSIVLVMLQPVAVEAWCTLCLFTALLTLISIPPAVDEVFASFQYLGRVRRAGRPVAGAFWGFGVDDPEEGLPPTGTTEGFLSGIRFPWPLVVSVCAGLGVVLLPGFADLNRTAANSDFIVGSLIVTFGVLATAEPTRTVRLVNVAFGLWVAAAPLVFRLSGPLALLHVPMGIIAAVASLPRGEIRERYGGWERHVL